MTVLKNPLDTVKPYIVNHSPNSLQNSFWGYGWYSNATVWEKNIFLQLKGQNCGTAEDEKVGIIMTN